MQYGGMLGIHPRSTSSGGSTGGVSLSGDELLQAQRLMHYKTYGEESYVFQHKDVWESLLQSFVAINDTATSAFATNFAVNQGGHVGKYIKEIYGMPEIDSGWDNLSTVDSVVDDLSAVEAGLNHATFSETMARLIVKYKPIEEIESSSQYKSIITCSLYGVNFKKTSTSYDHPALLISGESVASSYVHGSKSVAHALSGYYWIDIDGATHTLAEHMGNDNALSGANNQGTPYKNQEFLNINSVVKSIPIVSYTHINQVATNGGYPTKTTATAKHTYIPLYFED